MLQVLLLQVLPLDKNQRLKLVMAKQDQIPKVEQGVQELLVDNKKIKMEPKMILEQLAVKNNHHLLLHLHHHQKRKPHQKNQLHLQLGKKKDQLHHFLKLKNKSQIQVKTLKTGMKKCQPFSANFTIFKTTHSLLSIMLLIKW